MPCFVLAEPPYEEPSWCGTRFAPALPTVENSECSLDQPTSFPEAFPASPLVIARRTIGNMTWNIKTEFLTFNGLDI